MTEPTPPSSDRNQVGADRHEIFEQIALEHLRSGADTSKPASFLPLPVRFSALSALVVTGLGISWALLARVPVQVNGVASIIPQVQVSSATAQIGGILSFQVSGVGADRLTAAEQRNDQAVGQFWEEAIASSSTTLPFSRLNQVSMAAIAPRKGQHLVMPDSYGRSEPVDDLTHSQSDYKALFYPRGTIIAKIANDTTVADLDAVLRVASPKLQIDKSITRDRRERAVDYNKVTALLLRQHQRTEEELKERVMLFERLQNLWSKGFVSTTQLLSEQAQINALRSQVLQINRDQLNSEFSSTDQLQQADESILNSLQTTNQLQAALVNYITKAFIITPPSGAYIVAKSTRNNMEVRAGDEVFTYSSEKPTLPQIIPAFVDATTSQQLTKGMEVLVTPKGISRAQYGGIPGVVDEVGKLPLAPEALAVFAGGRTLASSIQRAVGTTYLVRVKLKQKEPIFCQQTLSVRCYQWSTNRRPPFPVRLGTLADVQINVQYRRPIEFVMPALRQALGLVVENR